MNAVSCGLLLYFVSNVSGYVKLQVVQLYYSYWSLLVRAGDLVPAGSCIIPTGIQTSDTSPKPTFDFTAKLFSNMKLSWDGPHMPLLAFMLVVLAGGDGADAVAAGAAAVHDVSPPPIVPLIHSTPGPSSASQVTPMRELTLVRDLTPMRDPTLMTDPTPVREPTPSPVREPTHDSPRPPSPPPRTEEVGPTTSTRPPNPTRHTSIHEDISEGGGDFVSSPQSNEAPQTPAATAAGRAEDFAALTALSLKLDRCLHRVTTLENELGITKKVLGGVVLKLVTRVKRLEGLLQQRKQRLVLSDSEGNDATPTEHDIDLAKTFTTSASAHVPENIPAVASVLAAATTIPASSSVATAVYVAAAPSSSIPTTADKGKAPMANDSLPADILTEQEREAEFARQQEELAQKAQAERVASSTEQGPGMSDQHRRELDAAQLIYTEADWLELLAKITTNSAVSKQLLGDDVTKENMNERMGMLLLRKRRELAEQSWVKPMTKTQQRDYMRDFVKNNSASHLERSNLLNFKRSTFRPKPTLDAPSTKRDNQGAPQVPTASSRVRAGVSAAPSFPNDVSVHAATSSAPADISVTVVSPAHAAVSVLAETVVHTVESYLDDPLTASEHVSTKPTIAAPTPSSSHKRHKHIAKKWVTPIVDMADAAMIKFDNDSDSDDDPLPYAPYASCEMVPSPLGSVNAYSDMVGHTKYFTTLRELLHMVEKTDLQKLLGAVDNLYQREDPDTRNQDSWRIRSWRLYPRAQVHILETVDGRVIYMFVDVSYPLSAATLERMLKHGLEVPKLLVRGDLTMAEQLSWLVQEQTALVKDKSNPLTVGSLLKTIWSSIHHLLNDKVLTSPEQTAIGKDVPNPFMGVMVCQKPLGYFSSPMIHVPRAELVFNPPGYVVPAGRVRSHSCCCVSVGKHSFCCQ
nr:hypothetical protein [Tanacetum cinerariifolium]